MNVKPLISRSLIATVLCVTGCEDLKRVDGDDGGGGGVPDAVQRSFDEGCAIASCHDSTRAGGLSLEPGTSADIIGGMSSQSPLPLVELGNVNGSYLAVKMLPEPLPDGVQRTGDRMPQTGPTDAEGNAIIIGWIAGAELPGGGGGTGGSDTGGMTTGTTGPPEPQLCGLMDVSPETMSPVVADDVMPMMIPTEIGTAIENNCGCHLTANLNMGVPPGPASIDMTTWAGWQAENMGMDPMPAHERSLLRIQNDASPMPTRFCNVDGMGAVITPADKALFEAWLTAGAPDGPTWAMMQ